MIDIVVGYDHAFGKNREGTIDFLRELSKTRGFGVTTGGAEELLLQTGIVDLDSHRDRDGNVKLASALLEGITVCAEPSRRGPGAVRR